MNMIYVPVLKAKMGELDALEKLTAEQKKLIMPILEVPEIAWDFVKDEPSKSVLDHVTCVAKLMEKDWDHLPFFLDFLPNIEATPSSDGKSSFETFQSLNETKNLNFVPVVGFDRSEVYLSQVIKNGKDRKVGLCLRAQYEDFDDGYDAETYENFLKKYELKPSEVDLVIDLSTVCGERGKTIYLALRLVLSQVPHLTEWRNLIIVASSFPKNLRGVERDSIKTLTRTEWDAWKLMYEKREKIGRLPVFGDYSISNPEFAEIDPRVMDMSAAIRYSSESEWVIFKGKSIRMASFKQFNKLSADLVSSKYFSGEEFSVGDKEVYKYATDLEAGTGNATTWRKIGNNHHFVLVLNQLAQFSK